MADVNWLLGVPHGNAGEAFAQSFQQAQEQNRQRAGQQAMARLVQNPNDEQALSQLAQIDPQAAMQFRGQQQKQLQDTLAQHQDNIVKGAEILRQFKPTDQASYTQALQAAQSVGIDISQVPQQFDPQYVDGVVKLADTFAPQPLHNGQLVPFTPGGGVARINPQTGQLETLVVPNTGGQQAGAPVGGNLPHVSDQSTYDAVPPGGQYIDPQGQVRTKGGQSGGSSAGGFPSGGQ